MTEKLPRSTFAERVTRLLNGADATQSDPDTILYGHTVFCQTSLPYRDPGDQVREWQRTNGRVHLLMKAGSAYKDEETGFVDLGLPYGPKPRLLLAHLNAEALRQGSPDIEVEESLTAFVKRLGLDSKGRNIVTIKDQLARLAAAYIVLGGCVDGQAVTIKTDIVSKFHLWFPKDERQRVLWPTRIKLSQEYFDSLVKHAVPLHDKALMALSGNAMGLDIYAWLAQRLHRIEWGQPVFVSWPALQGQFGHGYTRLRDFRRVFTRTLRDVHSQYRGADVELNSRGMTLRHSPPPVKSRWWPVARIP